MPLVAYAPLPDPDPPLVVTQEMVDAVMAVQQAHCAPSTWAKLAASLRANQFPFGVPNQS